VGRWAGRIVRLGDNRNECRALVGKAEGKGVRLADSVVTRLRVGHSGVGIPAGSEFYLFCNKSGPALGHTEPRIQWVLCAFPTVRAAGE
jgi:hypothetical protein